MRGDELCTLRVISSQRTSTIRRNEGWFPLPRQRASPLLWEESHKAIQVSGGFLALTNDEPTIHRDGNEIDIETFAVVVSPDPAYFSPERIVAFACNDEGLMTWLLRFCSHQYLSMVCRRNGARRIKRYLPERAGLRSEPN
jgi:hypothetical protein